MEQQYYQNMNFDNAETPVLALNGEYENCSFINYDFSEADFSNIHFIDCMFTGCNLSMAKLAGTAIRDVVFKDCKLMGLHFFEGSNFLFSAGFYNCIINLSSFYKMNLKKLQFKNAVLHEVDFSEADLSNALFDTCDLSNAVFDNTNLEKCDLRTSFNYSIDPDKNKIKKAKFAMPGVVGLLDKYDIIVEH